MFPVLVTLLVTQVDALREELRGCRGEIDALIMDNEVLAEQVRACVCVPDLAPCLCSRACLIWHYAAVHACFGIVLTNVCLNKHGASAQ